MLTILTALPITLPITPIIMTGTGGVVVDGGGGGLVLSSVLHMGFMNTRGTKDTGAVVDTAAVVDTGTVMDTGSVVDTEVEVDTGVEGITGNDGGAPGCGKINGYLAGNTGLFFGKYHARPVYSVFFKTLDSLGKA